MPKNKPKRELRKPKRVDLGKRYRCARCKKRSPKRIKPAPTTQNPYICPKCKEEDDV